MFSEKSQGLLLASSGRQERSVWIYGFFISSLVAEGFFVHMHCGLILFSRARRFYSSDRSSRCVGRRPISLLCGEFMNDPQCNFCVVNLVVMG